MWKRTAVVKLSQILHPSLLRLEAQNVKQQELPNNPPLLLTCSQIIAVFRRNHPLKEKVCTSSPDPTQMMLKLSSSSTSHERGWVWTLHLCKALCKPHEVFAPFLLEASLPSALGSYAFNCVHCLISPTAFLLLLTLAYFSLGYGVLTKKEQ